MRRAGIRVEGKLARWRWTSAWCAGVGGGRRGLLGARGGEATAESAVRVLTRLFAEYGAHEVLQSGLVLRSERQLMETHPALSNGPVDPTLADPAWFAFWTAVEENSVHAGSDWSRYFAGLQRIENEFAASTPSAQRHRRLAVDEFFCAADLGHDAGIVREALRKLLTHEIGVSAFTFAAVAYWKWARAHCPEDVPLAEAMIASTTEAVENAVPRTRENLKRMLLVEFYGAR